MKKQLESQPLISDSDIAKMRELGLTDEELEVLQNANVVAETVDMIPDGNDLDKLAQKIRKIFAGKNVGKEINDFFALAQKDPQLFNQIVLLYEVLDMHQELPSASTQKVSLADIDAEKDKEADETFKKAFATFAQAYQKLSPAEKAQLKEYLNK